MENNSSIKTGLAVAAIVLAFFAIVINCVQRNAWENDTLSYSYSSQPSSSISYSSSASYGGCKSYSTSQRAMTKEEAKRLRGTGYGNTRPNSSAECHKLAAAQVKCDNCGMHSSNGSNSTCNTCRAKGIY